MNLQKIYNSDIATNALNEKGAQNPKGTVCVLFQN